MGPSCEEGVNPALSRYADSRPFAHVEQATSILPSDIVSTLQHLRVVKYKAGEHLLCAAPELVDEKLARLDAKKGPVVDPECLHWAPLPVGHTGIEPENHPARISISLVPVV
jgi:hypothetical protein